MTQAKISRIDIIGQNGNDGEHYDTVYTPALETIKWIPLNASVPAMTRTYLVCHYDHTIDTCGWLHMDNMFVDMFGNNISNNIKYWAEMPKGPKHE